MPKSLYEILNIPENIILDQNNDINYWLARINDDNKENLIYANKAIYIVNKFHSYFHFEQSFAYALGAYVYSMLNEPHFQQECLTKALFQDPQNQQAIDFDKVINHGALINDLEFLLSYDKNLRYEYDFLQFAIGNFKPLKEIEILDQEIKQILSLENTIVISSNYHSHRTKIAKTISALLRNNLNEATKQIQEAIKMLEDAHPQYHQFASSTYLKRAKIFSLLGEVELSKNDIRKANDLVGSVAINKIDI